MTEDWRDGLDEAEQAIAEREIREGRFLFPGLKPVKNLTRMGTPGIVDIRDTRDPTAVGKEVLARHNGHQDSTP